MVVYTRWTEFNRNNCLRSSVTIGRYRQQNHGPGAHDKSSVLAVIIAYYPKKYLIENTYLLKNQVNHIVIIDNTPVESTPYALEMLIKNDWVTLIRMHDNKGIGCALNRGLEYAISNGYEWLLTMDQDSRVEPDHVKGMLNGANLYKCPEKIAQLFPSYKLEDGHVFNKEATQQTANGVHEIVESMTSGSMLRLDRIRLIGKFRESFFMDFVDIEFCLRVRRAGYANVQVSNVILHHALGEHGKHRRLLWRRTYVANYPPLRVYWQTRNRIWVAKSYLISEPRYILKDLIRLLFVPVKILTFEESKIAKLCAFGRGLAAGLTQSGKE